MIDWIREARPPVAVSAHINFSLGQSHGSQCEGSSQQLAQHFGAAGHSLAAHGSGHFMTSRPCQANPETRRRPPWTAPSRWAWTPPQPRPASGPNDDKCLTRMIVCRHWRGRDYRSRKGDKRFSHHREQAVEVVVERAEVERRILRQGRDVFDQVGALDGESLLRAGGRGRTASPGDSERALLPGSGIAGLTSRSAYASSSALMEDVLRVCECAEPGQASARVNGAEAAAIPTLSSTMQKGVGFIAIAASGTGAGFRSRELGCG